MRFSPGCKCCGTQPCGCYLHCWPMTIDPFAYVICYRPSSDQLRETCKDLILDALVATIAGVSNATCANCGSYNGSHCLRYVSRQITLVGDTSPSSPPPTQFYISEVVWEADFDAPCGPVVSSPLPAITIKFTDDGTTAKYTLYLNTTDTLGGVAAYELAASSWQCGRENTLSRVSNTGACNTPSTVTVAPCASCLLCDLSGTRRNIYEWQLNVSGIGDGSDPYKNCNEPTSCSDMNGTWVLGTGAVVGWSFTGEPVLNQCIWSLDTATPCTVINEPIFRFIWWLQVDWSTSPPTITVDLMEWGDKYFVSAARWQGSMTDCSGPFSLSLVSNNGRCLFGSSTISATPL